MSESTHLHGIMEKHNRIANLQVVFIDVEKYSKRRTLSQIEVIDAFTECTKEALGAVSKKYIDYAQTNSLNFSTDIITLPTGDGAATIFTFDGLHDIHLSLALNILENAYNLRTKEKCEKFEVEGWCNCHPYFNLRVGISEGKGIVFRDTNDQYNVAGGVVNMAARVMGVADRNQIMFTEEAHTQIVDMVDDPHFVDLFRQFSDIELKHNVTVNVYHFVDKSFPFLNTEPPEDLTLKKRAKDALGKMTAIGFPIPDMEKFKKDQNKTKLVEFIERMAETFSNFPGTAEPSLTIEAEPTKRLPNQGMDTDEEKPR